MPVHFPHNDCMIEAVLKEGCVHSDLKEFCAQQFRKNSATYLRYVSSMFMQSFIPVGICEVFKNLNLNNRVRVEFFFDRE